MNEHLKFVLEESNKDFKAALWVLAIIVAFSALGALIF